MKVTLYPSRILFREAKPVFEFGDALKKLAGDMAQTMKEYDGVGLAGPQANQDAKIIIVHTPEGDHTFVNPQIIQKSRETAEEEEGCLSLPGLFVNVKRAEEVEVACQTLEGETVKLKVSGLTSRIFQHEIDHVEGRLIIHRTPFLKRMRLRKKLREIANLS